MHCEWDMFVFTAERRIRVHTLCLPVTSTLAEVFLNANQYAIVGLLSKMGTIGIVLFSLNLYET